MNIGNTFRIKLLNGFRAELYSRIALVTFSALVNHAILLNIVVVD